MHQSLFYQNKWLGDIPLPRIYLGMDNRELAGSSYTCICPECGEVWGRVLRDKFHWEPLRLPCFLHGGGSFLDPRRLSVTTVAEFTDEWPEAAIRHEFRCLINQLEKGIEL